MGVHPLKAFRTERKLSQGQLAKLFGVSRETLTRWENGTRKPDEARLSLIYKKTGIPPSVLRPDAAKRAVIFAEAAE